MSNINEVRDRLERDANGFLESDMAVSDVNDLRALLADHARLNELLGNSEQLAPAIDLERIVPPVWLSEQIGGHFDDMTPGQAWRDGFNECRARTLMMIEQAQQLALIDGQASVRSSSEHSSEVAADPVTDDAVRRLVRAMENTPGDDLIEPNARLCRRLLVAALHPTKGEGE